MGDTLIDYYLLKLILLQVSSVVWHRDVYARRKAGKGRVLTEVNCSVVFCVQVFNSFGNACFSLCLPFGFRFLVVLLLDAFVCLCSYELCSLWLIVGRTKENMFCRSLIMLSLTTLNFILHICIIYFIFTVYLIFTSSV